MEDLNGLRSFLIIRFLRTVLVVSVAEYIILTLLSRTVFPFVNHYFFDDADLGSLGVLGILVIALIILATLFSEILKLIIPGRVGAFVAAISFYFTKISNLVLGRADISLAKLGWLKSVMLFAILLVSMVFIITPFILAAVHFARIIIKEFKKIEAAEKEKQREYERKRNRMLSDIAHDLRTPMTTVSGYAKALSDGLAEGDKKQEYLDAIRAKCERMNELITFLFEYVKTDSEGFELHIEKTDICELVRESAAMLYSDMEEKGMEPDIEIPDEKIMIDADKLQLSRVITNLICNAIRHNDRGTHIGVFVDKDDTVLRIMIADSGKRIDDKLALHIFEPFYMGDESRNSKGGTGLGLSIAEKIISLHGFRIRLIQSPYIKKYPKAEKYEKMFMITINLEEKTEA